MVCGEKYRYLIRNGKGFTADKTCELFCGELDYISWHAAADEFIPRVMHQYGALQRMETTLGGDHSRSLAIRQEFIDYEAHTRELISPARALLWESGLNMAGLVDQAVAVMGDGTCILEHICDAFEDLGERCPEVPGVGRRPEREKPKSLPDALADVATTIAVVGLLGGVGYVAWKYSTRPQAPIGAE